MPLYSRHTPTWQDFPSTATAIDAVDLEGYEAALLAGNAGLLVLLWNGTTYLPRGGDATLKADTSRARLFVGPVDPGTVTGVIVSDQDRWDQYT